MKFIGFEKSELDLECDRARGTGFEMESGTDLGDCEDTEGLI